MASPQPTTAGLYNLDKNVSVGSTPGLTVALPKVQQVIPPHYGPTASHPLADMLRLLKGRTARSCNQTLERSGAFWHHESYDHVVRNEREFERIFWYILNNPVRANLEEKWEDWPFMYCAE